MQDLWGMRSTPLLSSLPGPIWPGVVAPNRVLSMGQIAMYLMLDWIVWNRTVYMYKTDLAVNNLQWLIYYQTNQTYKFTKSLSHVAQDCFILIPSYFLLISALQNYYSRLGRRKFYVKIVFRIRHEYTRYLFMSLIRFYSAKNVRYKEQDYFIWAIGI